MTATWRTARSLDALLEQINDSAPDRAKGADGAIGDAAHAARASDHNPDDHGVVRARDFTHDPAGGFDAHAFADRLRAADDPRVAYIISRGRISTAGGPWLTYTGTNRHDKHIHVSVNRTDAADQPGTWPAVKKGTTVSTSPHAVSPFEGRVTSEFGRRGSSIHAGIDIAPPKPGQTGLPVYAMFAGTVKKLHRTAKAGGRASTWAPGRTGNGLLIANPDGEGNGYNHVAPLPQLKVGDAVSAGQLIGHNDTSGTQSGPHLHFELWTDWRNSNSCYNPRAAFARWEVAPGAAPKGVTAGQPATTTPKKKTYRNLERGSTGADVLAVARALRAEGYTKQKDTHIFTAQLDANIRDFQARERLVVDGVAGPITQKKLGL